MAIRVALNHKSVYRYDRRVHLSPHLFRLRPAPHCRTPIEAYSLSIDPEKHFIDWQQDPFGNYQARVVFPEPTRALCVEVDLIADMTVINPFDFFLETGAEHFPFLYEPQLREELSPFLEVKEAGPLLMEWLAGVPRTEQRLIDFLVRLNSGLSEDVKYRVRMEPGVQSCEQTLETETGSCRDTGWLLVQILRHLGLAARFVSGYLVQLAPDQKPVEGPTGPPADLTDLHAWCEVYAPGAGWIGLDPTSGLFAGEGHIPLACVPTPVSAAPVTGYADPCETEFTYSNTVQRIHEDPRPTKPYTEADWERIQALGVQVEAETLQSNLGLTIRSRPTFVSSEDARSPEWSGEVDGPKKRELGAAFLGRLRDSYGAGAALTYGQGEWYPDKSLPRWKFGCFWRKDDVPVWRDQTFLAAPDKDYSFGIQEAEQFVHRLVEGLGLSSDYVVPAYEDVLFYLWTEARLPVDVDPLAFDLKHSSERRRLAAFLQAGSLGEPVGYAVPIRWDGSGEAWESCSWRFRGGHLFLVPGDSPIGLRLPLDSIPQAPPEGTENRDPHTVFRTALCVEARKGRLHVFIPPLTHLKQYLRLLEAIEATAETLNIPVVLEGYEAPSDSQIEVLTMAPKQGVIEVSLPPMRRWEEIVHCITKLYAEAECVGLGAEKFMLDGRHTGTGGGNHVLLGGTTRADNPFLRRPHLLRSLITYWQHHPALSYLFSGSFIGPLGTAPRVDEGFDEQLYELERVFEDIATDTLPDAAMDSLLRGLMGGGTARRGEFCVEGLYAPDSASGLPGGLELRAFEMPPHPQMNIVQLLLVWTLIAKFWKTPYIGRWVRWGAELHDRFMLPHYIQADMDEVVADLQEAGYRFERGWLDPFFEFRFPKLGSVNVGGIELELRMALEPWQTFDARGGSGAAEGSIERLQVRVCGLTGSRHIVTCNGHPLILHGTGVPGEYVGGVRYQAWKSASVLQPTVNVHAPLVFDVVDTWNGRTLGGCTYHVSHPGGRNYDTFPVNAYEAEARRVSWFEAGVTYRSSLHSSSGVRIESRPEYAYTLDLRGHF